jgi:hypothetical protein
MTIVLPIHRFFNFLKGRKREAEREEMLHHFRAQMKSTTYYEQKTRSGQNKLTKFEWTVESFRLILEVRLWCEVLEEDKKLSIDDSKTVQFPALADSNFYKKVSGGKWF